MHARVSSDELVVVCLLFFSLDTPFMCGLMPNIMLSYLKSLKIAKDFDLAQCVQ